MNGIKKNWVIFVNNKWYFYLVIFLLIACNSSPKENNNQKDMEKNEEKIKLGEINSDIIIPDYQDLDLPYSKWEKHRSIELLEANGYGNTKEEWRKAIENKNGLIRGTAYYLLTRQVEKQDSALFHMGLQDMDETVQTLSALGLYQLGDQSKLSTLKRISKWDIDAHLAAMTAAGILGQLGDPSAFSIIQNGLKSKLDYIQILAVQNAVFFVPLHGVIDENGQKIDIWTFYEKALKNENPNIRTIAFLQLKELDSPESKKLLINFKQ